MNQKHMQDQKGSLNTLRPLAITVRKNFLKNGVLKNVLTNHSSINAVH
jgi:hypothetical protein